MELGKDLGFRYALIPDVNIKDLITQLKLIKNSFKISIKDCQQKFYHLIFALLLEVTFPYFCETKYIK